MLQFALGVVLLFPTHPQAGERQRLYRWLDSLELTWGPKERLGEIRTWSTFEPKRVWSQYGCLLSGSDRNFSARLLDQRRVIYADPPRERFELYRGEFRPLEPRAVLERLKQRLSKPAEYVAPLPFEARTSAFVFARLSDLYGYPDLGDWFYNYAQLHPSNYDYRDRDKSLEHQVENELGRELVWTAKGQLRISEISRAEVLQLLACVADKFPPSAYQREAQSYAEVLGPMVKEDEVRTPLTEAELKALPPARRAEELVWQLRNQRGGEYMEPGYADVFHLDTENSPRAAAQLLQLGPVAVPALIAALDDKRYTRTVEGGMHVRNPQVLRIRDAAVQILDKIASRNFSDNYQGIPGDSDIVAESIKSKVKDWWSEYQSLGERGALAVAVARGHDDSYMVARTLVSKYPKFAFEPLRQGIQTAQKPGVAWELMLEMQGLGDLRIPALAHKYLGPGSERRMRIAAAKALEPFEPGAAVAALAKEWAQLGEVGVDDRFVVRDLIVAMIESRHPAAARAFAAGFDERPQAVRVMVIQALEEHQETTSPSKVPKRESSEFNRTMEDVLASQLLVHKLGFGDIGVIGILPESTERVSEAASRAIATLWPKKYRYAKDLSESDRNRECLANLNIWRASRGKSPMGAPAGIHISSLPLVTLRPLFQRTAAGADDGEPIVARGLGALAPLAHYLTGISPAERSRLEPVAARLANIVREVKVVHETSSTSDVARGIRGLAGKSLTPDDIFGLERQWVQAPGLKGVRLLVDRTPGIGISITADVVPPGAAEKSDLISYSYWIRRPGSDPFVTSGGALPDHFFNPHVTDEPRQAIEEALSARHNLPVIIMFSFQRGIPEEPTPSDRLEEEKRASR